MFTIEKKINGSLGRAGVLKTYHGEIKTPAFTVAATKGTVKTLSPEQILEARSQAVLANTYHLYLQPGEEKIKKAGSLHKFMNWNGPIFTDSGGFQVFSLGAAYGNKISKIIETPLDKETRLLNQKPLDKNNRFVKIDEDGVTFKNPTNGEMHRFTPEKSIDIQHKLGADVIFTFDECTSPLATFEYQVKAMERTHRWAERCLSRYINKGEGKIRKFTKLLFNMQNEEPGPYQQLFGIVQGGRFEELRKTSARKISKMGFDGFGIGGSFEKEDMHKALRWVNTILPEEKPRHLLGIGEPKDILIAIENGADLFDCVFPTRVARNGTLLTKAGRISILKKKYASDDRPIEEKCECYSCRNFSRSYTNHLFKAREIFGLTLATIHNVFFINNLFSNAREHILEGTFSRFKEDFLRRYK